DRSCTRSRTRSTAAAERPALLTRLPDPGVSQLEIVLPGHSVVADLPGTGDGVAVVAERAHVALLEIKRREIRRVSPELPDTVAEAHLVNAGDAARVEVVLEVVPVVFRIDTD